MPGRWAGRCTQSSRRNYLAWPRRSTPLANEHPMPSRSLRVAAAAFTCCCLLAVPAVARADSFTFQVQVTTVGDQPIEDANVNLVGLYYYSFIPHATPGAI